MEKQKGIVLNSNQSTGARNQFSCTMPYEQKNRHTNRNIY